MAKIQSLDYRNTNAEGSGNVCLDPMTYTLTGVEAAGTTVLLRRMFGRNVYTRIRALATAGVAAVTTVSLGYVSHDPDYTDDPDYFVASIDLATADQEAFAIAVGAAATVDFEHSVSMTTIAAPQAGNAGKVVKFVTEFMSKAP